MPPELEDLEEEQLQDEANHEEVPADDETEGDASFEDESVDDESEDELAADSDDEEGDASPTEYEEADHTYQFNGEKYEFDDRIKALIKDKESEELVRELVEKADYTGYSRERQHQLREENSQLQHTEAQRQQAVQQMQTMVQKGDLRSFHKTWGIHEDAILQEAMNIMRVREMAPEDRQAYEQSVQAQEQNWQMQHQMQQQQQYIQNMAVQQRDSELQQTLSNDQFAQAAYDFDQRAGRQGAFREEIIKRGQWYANVQGKDVAPQQLAQELMAYVPQRQGGQAGQGQPPRVVTSRKPTLPKVGGNSGSPVKSTVRSIADLRKLANAANT